jgi:hypothetical protein
LKNLFVTHAGGYTGKPSRITLQMTGPTTLSTRALAHAGGDVTVHGSITPAISGVPVEVALTTGVGGWTEEATVTGIGGWFSHTFREVESTTWIDAYWTGSSGYRSAVAGPVRLLVRR